VLATLLLLLVLPAYAATGDRLLCCPVVLGPLPQMSAALLQ
jgi:hypothetical protein